MFNFKKLWKRNLEDAITWTSHASLFIQLLCSEIVSYFAAYFCIVKAECHQWKNETCQSKPSHIDLWSTILNQIISSITMSWGKKSF